MHCLASFDELKMLFDTRKVKKRGGLLGMAIASNARDSSVNNRMNDLF